MTRYLYNLLLAAVSLLGASAGPTEMLTRSLPARSKRVIVGYMEAARCPDGAVWLVWSTVGWPDSFGRIPFSERASSPDIGLFCRCTAGDGSVVVPATQIVGPVMSPYHVAPLSPSSFFALPVPGGGVLVFAGEMDPLAGGADGGKRGRHWTNVIAVDRRGRVRKSTFDGYVDGSRVKHGEPMSAAFWHWFDSSGGLHYICSLWNLLVRVAELGDSGTTPAARPTDSLYYAMLGPEDSARFAADSPGKAIRRSLRWIRNGWDYSAVTALGDDTLVVAYIPPGPGRIWSWRAPRPGDTLIVYRFRLSDFSLLDSARSVTDQTAGRGFAGASIPRAALVRVPGGFEFFVPALSGTQSFRITADGRPMVGKREDAAMSSVAEADTASGQLMQILQPDRSGIPRKFHWFGFTSAGGLCHDYYPR